MGGSDVSWIFIGGRSTALEADKDFAVELHCLWPLADVIGHLLGSAKAESHGYPIFIKLTGPHGWQQAC